MTAKISQKLFSTSNVHRSCSTLLIWIISQMKRI